MKIGHHDVYQYNVWCYNAPIEIRLLYRVWNVCCVLCLVWFIAWEIDTQTHVFQIQMLHSSELFSCTRQNQQFDSSNEMRTQKSRYIFVLKNDAHLTFSFKYIPATTVSARCRRTKTCSMSPTSVHACKLRTLLRKIAMNTLHISAWKRKAKKKARQLNWQHPGAVEKWEFWVDKKRRSFFFLIVYCEKFVLITSWRTLFFSEKKTPSLQRNGCSSESISHTWKVFHLHFFAK